MSKKKIFTRFSLPGQGLALLLLCVLCGQSLAADYPLEIIQPQPSLNTFNRFYKAYPGIEYNVRLGVIGGSYPLSYELTTAPSGMAINSSTGEITWSNPVGAGSPHTVLVTVEDQESTTTTVTWPITVTTSGFKFVDSTVGSSGDGTIGSPYKTLADAHSNAATNDFLYFRGGTYNSTLTLPNGNWWQLGSHPGVWLGYPGETANLNFASKGIFFTGSSNKLYIDNFNVDVNANSLEKAIIWPGGVIGIVMRHLTFSGLTDSAGNNSSYLMATSSSNPGNYTVVQDNVVTGGSGYFFLGYNNTKVLVEDNIVSGMTGASHGISPKDGNNDWFIRGNDIEVAEGAVFIQGYDSRGVGNSNIFIEYNKLIGASPSALSINANADGDLGPLYIRRNTFRGRVYIRGSSENYSFSKNVIINSDSGSTDRIMIGGGNVSNIIYDDNLTGSEPDNIVDSQSYLTTSYGSYIGSHGFEIAIRLKPPSAVGVD